MSNLAIETHGLRRQFGEKTAVADLTLAVSRGEIFGFLGPNGAGKTTSVKMLLGLVAPTAGRAHVLGAPAGDVVKRARIGFLPEHFRFHDWLTGREFLSIHGRLYGMPANQLKPRIEQLLTRVDLIDSADQKLREYSKGMLQRIGLAQALLNRPDLVFLDEPTSGLDPLGRLLVRDIIWDLRKQGTTVFLNSHLLSEVEITCDRVAFIKRGSVVREMALGQASDVDVELKLGTVTARLLSGLAQFGHNIHQRDGHVRLQVDSEEQLPKIARWLIEEGAEVYHIGRNKKSLEELFVEIIGQDERPG